MTLQTDDVGHVLAVEADSRPRQAGRALIPTPWGGRYGRYKEYGGLHMPGSAEVFWRLPEGESIYFRGEILAAGVWG